MIVGPRVKEKVLFNARNAPVHAYFDIDVKSPGNALVTKSMSATHAITHHVNIALASSSAKCDCKNFQLEGIPCEEACALILRMGLRVEDYVRNQLKIHAGQQLLEQAVGNIKPLKVISSQLTPSNPLVLPPLLQPPPGRPAKKRKTKESVRRA